MRSRPGFVIAALAAVAAAFLTTGASSAMAITDTRGDMQTRPGTETTIRYGPFTLNANSQIHNQINQNQAVPCTNCRITDIVPNLVYDGDANHPTGTTANLNTDMMLHHFVMLNPGASDLGCPGGIQSFFGERFFAAGNERSHVHLPSNFGYTNTSSGWTLISHLVNKGAVQKRVSIEITYRHRPTSETRPARPVWLDIDGCGDSEYTIAADPAGPTTAYSDTHSDWTSSLTGEVIGIGGHLHDVDITNSAPCLNHCAEKGGGIAVSAEIVGGPSSTYYGPTPPNNPRPADLTGATLCRSEAYYGTPFAGTEWRGHLDTMSQCGVFDVPNSAQDEAYPAGAGYPYPGVRIQSGQIIRLHSEYENGTDEAQHDVMGIMQMWIGNSSYARPQGAAKARVPLVIAYKQCVPPYNRTHGPSLSYSSCNPPVQESTVATVGTTDANGAAPKFNGSMRYTVQPGVAGGADDADVLLDFSATDIRSKTTGLPDYSGLLKVVSTIRVTDKANSTGTTFTEDGTVTDTPLSVNAPCTTTPGDSTVGSTCSVATSADAVLAGTVVETKRSNWELGDVKVYTPSPDVLFLRQGVFVP